MNTFIVRLITIKKILNIIQTAKVREASVFKCKMTRQGIFRCLYVNDFRDFFQFRSESSIKTEAVLTWQTIFFLLNIFVK